MGTVTATYLRSTLTPNPGGLDPIGQDIAVTPLALDFGVVTTGFSNTLNATISNAGDAGLTVTGVGITGSLDFALGTVPGIPFTVLPGATVTVPVIYTPSDVGADTGTLDITSNDPDEGLVQVNLSGTGQAPATVCDINVAPLALNFGSVEVSTTKTLTTIAIGNTGTLSCTVNALTVAGSADFMLGAGAPTTPFSVAPGATVNVPVDYAPLDVGGDSGTLDIASDDVDEPVVSVSLSGTGFAAPTTACTVSPLALDFGFVDPGNTVTLTATVTNPATSPNRCTVNSATFDNTEFALNPLSQQTPFNVWQGSSVNVSLDYTPADTSPDTNTMTLNILDADRVTVFDAPVTLTGNGGGPVTAPDIDVNPLSLGFGVVDTGASATRTTTIANLGDADLTVTGLTVGGSTEFQLNAGAPTPPFSVAPGTTADVPVDYAPVDVGADSGTLDVASDDPDEPTVPVVLSGTGQAPPATVCDIDVNPLALAFGSVDTGTTATLTTTIGNTGSAACTVNALTVTGSADFMLGAGAPATPFMVAIGATVNVPVVYAPSAVGDDSGTLDIASNDPDENPLSVTLAGSGVTPPPPDGQALYNGTCSGCHVNNPDGTPGKAGRTAADISAAVNGTSANPTCNANMGFLQNQLTTADIEAIGAYLQSFGPPTTPGGLYSANCAGCHGDPQTGGPAPAAPRKIPGARTCSIDGAIFGNPEAEDDTPFPNGVPAMQFLQGTLDAAQIALISDFLNSISVTAQQRFVTTCAGCHGIDASGGFVEKDIRGERPDKVRDAIDGKKAMRFLGCLPRSDTDQVGNYLRGLDDNN